MRPLGEPHHSKGKTGRKPFGLNILLRVHFFQQWFALSYPGVEDALYESALMRRFAGVDLSRAPAPDEATTLNFRPNSKSGSYAARCWTLSADILRAAAFASRP